MSQFFDPDIAAIAPDSAGAGVQQPVVRIDYIWGDTRIEITLDEKSVQAVVDAMFAAKRLIP